MHKVLVVAYYFPPMGLSGVQRTLKFVKYLKNYGWEPTVITTSEVGYFAHDQSLQKELNETGVKVIRIGGKEPNSFLARFGTLKLPREFIRKLLNKISQTFFIPDNKIFWSRNAVKKTIELINGENFDLIFVTGPPFSLFYEFSKFKKHFHIPFFFDYRDIWYESYFAFYPTPLHKILHKKMEYKSLKAADKISVTNRIAKEKLIKTYNFLTYNDIIIISHGFDHEDFEKIPAQPKSKNRMALMYSGIFMVYNTPKYLLKAFKELTIERPDITKNIELHFVGFLRKENVNLIQNLNLQEFVFDHGYLNHDESIAKIKSADILWMMVGKRKNIDSILPGKLYEYMGTAKPILACVPEGAAKLALSEYPASFVCEPDNINQIKETIIRLFDLYKRNEFPVIDEEIIAKYRRDFLTEQLAKQMNIILKV
ncbi:MAG: glycosyltransferase family 4 protein [Ignavibacteriaceae bacterium]|nr:glycosyltransferase family 4 protein [Ignavibacteriaceae bacterium]